MRYQRDLLARIKARTRRRVHECCGKEFSVHPRVFEPNLDTQALIEALPRLRYDTFLEIGGGTGAVSVFAALRGASGLVVDINPAALANIAENLERHGVDRRVEVRRSDLFEQVQGRFDLIIANLPFMDGVAADVVDRSIYEEGLGAWRRLASEVQGYLNPGGVVLIALTNFCEFEQIGRLFEERGGTLTEVSRVESEGLAFVGVGLGF